MKTLANTNLMNNRLLSLLAALAIMIFAASCGEDDMAPDDGSIPTELSEEVDLESEAGIESLMEDLDNVTEAGMDFVNAGGRVLEDDIIDCATVTHDEENKTVTIDYGDGCEGPNGRLRRGKIVIVYTDRRLVPGAMKTVTPEDFFIDSVQVEGTRIFTNIMESETDVPKFRIQLVGGRLTFADGTTATRDADHTRTWIRGANPRLDEAEVEGGAEGTDRDENVYRVEILERIIYKRSCGLLPVAGIKQITINGGEHVITYDYGDGRCDNLVTVTINGRTQEMEINPRRFKVRKRG